MLIIKYPALLSFSIFENRIQEKLLSVNLRIIFNIDRMKKRQIKTSFTRWGVCATVCTRFNRTGLQNPKWSGNVLSSVMEQYNTNVFVSKLFKNYLNTLQHEQNQYCHATCKQDLIIIYILFFFHEGKEIDIKCPPQHGRYISFVESSAIVLFSR